MPRKRSKPVAEHIEQQSDRGRGEVPPKTSGSEPTAAVAPTTDTGGSPVKRDQIDETKTITEPASQIHQELCGGEMDVTDAKSSSLIDEIEMDEGVCERLQQLSDNEKIRPGLVGDRALAKEAVERYGKDRIPDPHPYASVTLGATNDSPRMRLWRSEKRNEFAITFDEKPDAKYLEMVKAAGFRRNSDNTAWVMKMPHGERWKAEVAARQAFNDIGDNIRTDLGLPVYRGYE